MRTTKKTTKKAVAAGFAGLVLAWGAQGQGTALPDDLPRTPRLGAPPRPEALEVTTPPRRAQGETNRRYGFTPGEIKGMSREDRSDLLNSWRPSNPRFEDDEKSAEYINLLLEHGADPNYNPHHYYSRNPLRYAAGRGYTRSVDALIKGGARVNNPSEPIHRPSPLMAAAGSGNPRTVDRLLEAGADPGGWTHEGKSSLQIALKAGGKKTALLRSTRDQPWEYPPWENVRLNTKFEITPEQREIVKALLRAGADPNAPTEEDVDRWRNSRFITDNEKQNIVYWGRWQLAPLTIALAAGDMELVNLLLDHGADPRAPNIVDQNTPPPLITCAARCCDRSVAERLVLAGADFDAKMYLGKERLEPDIYVNKEKIHDGTRKVTVTGLDVARKNNCPTDLIAFFENPNAGVTKTLFDGIPGLFGIGSPPAPEGDASVTDGDRSPEPAGRPTDPGDSEGGAAGSAR